MNHAVVSVPAAPVRRKARHQREMVNQLLFGEGVRIMKTKGDLWVKVQSLHDGYEGWITKTLLRETNEKTAKSLGDLVTTGLINTLSVDNAKMNIPLGS